MWRWASLRRGLMDGLVLSQASIHAIMESDDRVTFVIKHLDDALAELDKMDSTIGLYKTQLSVRWPFTLSDSTARIVF